MQSSALILGNSGLLNPNKTAWRCILKRNGNNLFDDRKGNCSLPVVSVVWRSSLWLQHNKHSRHILGVHANIPAVKENFRPHKIIINQDMMGFILGRKDISLEWMLNTTKSWTSWFIKSTHFGLPCRFVILDLTSECRYEIICWFPDSLMCRQAGYKISRTDKSKIVSWPVAMHTQ